ncbi:hypothetical protein C2E21_4909 [Chlorella sorokiniana]|uniref:Uncharacterized protein n=1 Tax=Chlorella sorokiniana TaxID=3076 RepID=A0A2P6TPI1_CHLSO|nr:hypothetical protein C2E21_4909 [Chlorella sorokiniana]|eukprot:PRW55942.1 hypothetical protein C2E21_4909 [Chlorella sorokiniana]
MQAATALLPGLQGPLPSLDSSLPLSPSAAAPPNKMVSLELLLGTPSTPLGPDPLLPAVDPSDPLVQQLVQDKSFLTAVQTSQLHAAATAAVRLLQAHFTAASGEFKRPPDRRREAYVDDVLMRPAAAPRGGSLVVQRQMVEPRHREALRGMRLEVLALEDVIPWNSVRRTWKTKRTTWRRQVKQTEVIADFATRLKELKAALLTEEQALPGCGSTWRAQLEVCIQGKGSYGLLSAAWEEMRNTVRSWLEGRSKPPAQSATQLQASAARAVRAMHAALASPSGLAPSDAAADAALVQVPLESIVGGDSGAALQAVQQAIELEQRVVGARLAAAQGQAPSPSQAQPSEGGDPQQQQQQQQAADGKSPGDGQPLVGYFTSVAAGWCDSFDSGAPSDPAEQGSSDTDLDSDYD